MKRAFTLLEMMIALALTLALAAGVLAFLWNLEQARGPVLATSDRDRAVDEWLDRVESDLLGAVAATSHGAGIDGGSERLVVRSRRVGAGSGAGLRERLADLRLSVHEFKDGAIAVGGGPDAPSPPASAEVVRGVGAVRFRFASGSSWSDHFDSAQARELPLAVEVSLWLSGPGEPPVVRADSTEVDGGLEAPPGDEPPLELALPERPPDRVRVIPIPDGGGGS